MQHKRQQSILELTRGGTAVGTLISQRGGGKRRGKQYASLPDRCISHCQARLPLEHHSCEEFLMVERRASDHATLSPLHLGSR